MKIVIFGSTGKAGIETIKQSLERGYEVVAYARNPAKIDFKHEKLTVIKGELNNISAITQAIQGSDAVISLLGASGKIKDDSISRGVKNIISIMEQQGVSRIIQVSTSAAKEPLDKRDLYFDFMGGIVKVMIPLVYSELQTINTALRNSKLNWTLVRVPFLNEEPLTKNLRIGYKGEKKVRRYLSRADLAWFMLEQVDRTDYLKKAPFISN